ncbi:MAG: ComEC/Rec2 family competence protein [Ruminococcaceae bacterium]|nr:ComEC/Rec2 family competence protein [Oscillospiraceae bacterium]
MNIFRKRPLSLILCIALGVFFLFTYQSNVLRILLIVASILPLILSLIPKIKLNNRILPRIITIVALCSITFSYVFFDLYFAAHERFDGSVKIIGTVTDVAPASSYSTKLTVRTNNIDNRPFSQYNITVYLSKAEAATMPEGTEIEFDATLHAFSKDSRGYNTSIGVSAYADDVENVKIIRRSEGGLSAKLAHYKEYLCRYITTLTDGESGALLSALLFGQRDYLSGQIRLDFQRIGISHILALSGMHLAILSIGIGRLLSLFGIKKKIRVAVTSVFILLYMALTGFSVSVMRAGFMVIIASLLFLFSHTRDSITSLTAAVSIICLLDPCAIFSTSLWLSALATLGIIVLGEYTSGRIKKPKNRLNAILRSLWLGIMASVFAISATLAISTFTFGGMSCLGMITTLVFSLIAEVIMYLGCITLIIGWLIPIGILVFPFTKLLTWLAELLSRGEFVYLSTNYLIISLLIIVYTVLFYLFFVISVKEKRKAVIFLTSFFIFLTVMPLAAGIINDFDDEIIYLSDSKCDEMLVRSENEVCLINSAQYSKNLAYTSLDLLEAANVTYLDKYYLTHYSWSIDDELDVLLSSVLVEKIYLPAPRNDDEETILNVIKKSVEDYRTKIILLESNMLAVVGEYKIQLLYSVPYGEGTSMNAFRIMNDDKIITYVSSGLLNGEAKVEMENYIAESNTVIFGEHGKKYKEKLYLYDYHKSIDNLIINSENLFLSQLSMQKYMDGGASVISNPQKEIYIED